MSGSLQINPALSLTYNRIYVILFTLLVFLGLLLILKRTTLGLQVRAVSQNRAMARALGVRSARVDALTFGLGAGVAGVAGVALSQLTNVGPNGADLHHRRLHGRSVRRGRKPLEDPDRRPDPGGRQQAPGALGRRRAGQDPGAGIHILFIPKRPRGLFPQRGRAAEG